MSNQNDGYNSFNIAPPGGSGMITVVPTGANSACGYNNSGLQGLSVSGMGVFPDSTPYKQSANELRQYILGLESTRQLRDINDVNFTRSPQPGDILAYDHTTGFWVLVDFVSGGEF